MDKRIKDENSFVSQLAASVKHGQFLMDGSQYGAVNLFLDDYCGDHPFLVEMQIDALKRRSTIP